MFWVFRALSLRHILTLRSFGDHSEQNTNLYMLRLAKILDTIQKTHLKLKENYVTLAYFILNYLVKFGLHKTIHPSNISEKLKSYDNNQNSICFVVS